MSLPDSNLIQDCVGCKNALLPDQDQIGCVLCKSKYDLLCANISFECFHLMNSDHKRTWRCPECRSKQPKADNTNTPVRSTASNDQVCDRGVTPSELDISYVTQRRKPVKQLTPERSVPLMQPGASVCESDLSDIVPVQEITLFWKELRAARIEMSNLRSTLADVTATMNKNNERLGALEARMDTLEGTINVKSLSDIENLEGKIVQLKQELQDREQDLLSNDIEIAGIPEAAGEGVIHIVLSVANKLGVELEERDIVDARRAGPQRALVEGGPAPRPRNIAVRITRRSRRDALLKAARVRRGATTADMGVSGPTGKFYVNERLTKFNRQLFQRARELAVRFKWRFVWSRDGKIFTRQENGSTRHRLHSEGDIVKVFGDGAVCSET